MNGGGRIAMTTLVVLTVAGSAWAQLGAPMGQQAAMAPAPPETLTVRLDAVDAVRAPLVRPLPTDTLRFGDVWNLELDFGPGAVVPDSLTVSAPWLVPVPGAATSEDGRLTLPVRAFRAGPMRLAWGENGTPTEVVAVAGRSAPGVPPAPVRDPWRPVVRWWPLALAVVIGLVVVALAARLLRRRKGVTLTPVDGPSAEPAWARFALDVADLRAGGLPVGEGARPFLDRLDTSVRRYLTDRFGIAGASLAAGETAAALADRRHPPEIGHAFDVLLDELDRCRYAPPGDVAGLPDRLLRDAYRAVAATVGARPHRGLGATVQVAADAAWRGLETDLGDHGDRREAG